MKYVTTQGSVHYEIEPWKPCLYFLKRYYAVPQSVLEVSDTRGMSLEDIYFKRTKASDNI